MKYFKDTDNKVFAYDSKQVYDGLSNGMTEISESEMIELTKTHNVAPSVVTMRQARLALLQEGLLATIESAIQNGTDEAMKIEWEYATEVRRDWASLVTLTESLGMTSTELDSLFTIASTL